MCLQNRCLGLRVGLRRGRNVTSVDELNVIASKVSLLAPKNLNLRFELILCQTLGIGENYSEAKNWLQYWVLTKHLPTMTTTNNNRWNLSFSSFDALVMLAFLFFGCSFVCHLCQKRVKLVALRSSLRMRKSEINVQAVHCIKTRTDPILTNTFQWKRMDFFPAFVFRWYEIAKIGW